MDAGSLLITDIGELALVPAGPVPGRTMSQIPVRSGAALRIENGRIAGFEPPSPMRADLPVISAQGNAVVPALVDCHTHVVFAGSRHGEFVDRCRGESYEQIARRGGGIRVSVQAVRQASIEQLVAESLPRLQRMLMNGVTCVEIKTGYGLRLDDELKMLEAMRLLRDLQPVELVATYLPAHVVPAEFQDRSTHYIDEVASEAVLRRIAEQQLAEFCDVFVDNVGFDTAAAERLLQRAAACGLRPKLHVDQLTDIGGAMLAGRLHAVSADHLEHIGDGGVAALKSAGTIPVLLPGCTLFLGTPPAPARRLMDADLPVALATDCNPGSSMIESLPLVMSLGCCLLGMTPIEVLVASTANASAAVARQDRLGAMQIGHQADVLILDLPHVEQWAYNVGRNCVRTVIQRGQVVHEAAMPAGQVPAKDVTWSW
jgi:imidazolonepropionase